MIYTNIFFLGVSFLSGWIWLPRVSKLPLGDRLAKWVPTFSRIDTPTAYRIRLSDVCRCLDLGNKPISIQQSGDALRIRNAANYARMVSGDSRN